MGARSWSRGTAADVDDAALHQMLGNDFVHVFYLDAAVERALGVDDDHAGRLRTGQSSRCAPPLTLLGPDRFPRCSFSKRSSSLCEPDDVQPVPPQISTWERKSSRLPYLLQSLPFSRLRGGHAQGRMLILRRRWCTRSTGLPLTTVFGDDAFRHHVGVDLDVGDLLLAGYDKPQPWAPDGTCRCSRSALTVTFGQVALVDLRP